MDSADTNTVAGTDSPVPVGSPDSWEQRTFDKVAAHLLKQNAKSRSTTQAWATCAYRGVGGLKCAVGCLIPDDLYSPRIEGSVYALPIHVLAYLIELPVDHELRVRASRMHFLSKLQMIHDAASPEAWRRVLHAFGVEFSLRLTVLEPAAGTPSAETTTA